MQGAESASKAWTQFVMKSYGPQGETRRALRRPMGALP